MSVCVRPQVSCVEWSSVILTAAVHLFQYFDRHPSVTTFLLLPLFWALVVAATLRRLLESQSSPSGLGPEALGPTRQPSSHINTTTTHSWGKPNAATAPYYCSLYYHASAVPRDQPQKDPPPFQAVLDLPMLVNGRYYKPNPDARTSPEDYPCDLPPPVPLLPQCFKPAMTMAMTILTFLERYRTSHDVQNLHRQHGFTHIYVGRHFTGKLQYASFQPSYHSCYTRIKRC
jgi:hypothetical protein